MQKWTPVFSLIKDWGKIGLDTSTFFCVRVGFQLTQCEKIMEFFFF